MKMRISSTHIGLFGFLEKIIRTHPLIYIFFRTFARFTNIFEKDFDGLKKINFPKNINIIDVGASDGIASKFFLNNLSVNKIICYEPHKAYVKILKQNKKLIVKPYAIGEKNQKITIYYPKYNFFKFEYNMITYTHYDKKLMQHFIKDFKFNSNLKIVSSILNIKKIKFLKFTIDLIKIDTNGYEYNIIKSMEKIVKKNKPALIIEINKDSKKINTFLKRLGYVGYYYSSLEDKLVKKQIPKCTNKFFLQKNHLS